jgi:hypothetical protein
MPYKYKPGDDPDDACAPCYSRVLGGEFERAAYNFSSRCGALWLKLDTKKSPCLKNAIRLFQILDPLVARVVTVRGTEVRTEWENRSRMPTTPLRVSGNGLKRTRRTKEEIAHAKTRAETARR